MGTTHRQRLTAELVGTGILVCVVVGSGIMATNLSSDTAVALLVNAVSTVSGLGVLIWLFGPVSGAHFNPVVTAWALSRRTIGGAEAAAYVVAQVAGAVLGALLANVMFGVVGQISTHARVTAGTVIGEVIATAGLVTVIALLGRGGRSGNAALVVPAWIGSAYFFTSSTSFANPAVTIGRVFSNTFAGIAPQSVPAFVLAQLAGLVLAIGLVRAVGE